MGGQKSSEQSDRELGDLVEELIERAGAATAARILGKILRDEQTVIAQAAETGTVPDYARLDLSDYPQIEEDEDVWALVAVLALGNMPTKLDLGLQTKKTPPGHERLD